MLVILHDVFVIVHLLAGAAWFGAMVYSLFELESKARRFFQTDSEFEEFRATVANGARWKVVAGMSLIAITGLGLIVTRSLLVGFSTTWVVLVLLKVIALLCAAALFYYISWRLWPRRIFATPNELPRIRQQFRWIGVCLLTLAGFGMVCGVLIHLL